MLLDIVNVLEAALDHHRAGRRDEAETLYRQVLDADPAEPTALYLYGLMSFEAGRPDQAERLLERLAIAKPGHAEAHVALANIRHWRGRYAEAADGYRQALALQPDHPGALINLGAALRDLQHYDAAVAAFEDAIQRLADPVPARAALAGTLIVADRPREAALAYRAALALDDEDGAMWAGLALALLNTDDVDQALSAARAALDRDPDQVDAWVVEGAAMAALRRFEDALVALERAVALDPTRAGAYLNLGNAYAALERADPAIAALQKAVELDPRLKEAHASLGSVCLLVGETEAAERHCWLALALDSQMVSVHQNLASLYADQSDMARARHHRDAAYRAQNVFVSAAVHARARVLVLNTTESGNVPLKFLMPAERFTRIDWFVEYADADQAAGLPAYDLVFNAIGDADLAGPTEAPVARFLAVCERPFLNRPEAVARTRRDRIGALLGDLPGVVVPRSVRLAAADVARHGLAGALRAEGLAAPVIVRPHGSHGGKGLRRALSETELAALELDAASDLYVTEYRDFASSDGLYRKYRFAFVDRRPYPYHLAIGDDWLVHYESAPMAEHADRREEELRFLADPQAAIGSAAMAAMTAIGRRLDLDFAGVDFTVLPDGRVMVFEANATMLVHPEDSHGIYAAKNVYVGAILDAFQERLLALCGR